MKKAFTLVELLVVVLIIGILTAVALPMYQGTVDKSHWSTMLPGAKAIKDAEEAFRMANGEYSSHMEELAVTMNNEDLTFSLITPNNTSDPNVIRVTSSKLPNVRLASYLDGSPTMAGQLHCEALKDDVRANRLCEKLLIGQDLTETDGYIGYLLDQEIDKATCDHVGRFFGQKTSTCYKTNAERCVGLGMPYNSSTQFCGYHSVNGKEINEGGVCESSQRGDYSTATPCQGTIVNDGGICKGNGLWTCSKVTINKGGICEGNNYYACYGEYYGGICVGNNSGACVGVGGWGQPTTMYEGSVCIGKAENSCRGDIFFKTGSKCVASASGSCNGNYQGGCCEEGVLGHTYCPSSAPKC